MEPANVLQGIRWPLRASTPPLLKGSMRRRTSRTIGQPDIAREHQVVHSGTSCGFEYIGHRARTARVHCGTSRNIGQAGHLAKLLGCTRGTFRRCEQMGTSRKKSWAVRSGHHMDLGKAGHRAPIHAKGHYRGGLAVKIPCDSCCDHRLLVRRRAVRHREQVVTNDCLPRPGPSR